MVRRIHLISGRDFQKHSRLSTTNAHINTADFLQHHQVVLATDMSLDYGFSKALLLRWASGSANTVLLTGRGHGDTTARSLLVQMEDQEKAAAVAAAKKGVAGRRPGAGAGVRSVYGGVDEEEDGDGEEEETPLTVSIQVRVKGEPEGVEG